MTAPAQEPKPMNEFHQPVFGERTTRPWSARCKKCGEQITREEWTSEECPGKPGGCPVAAPTAAVAHPERERLINGSLVTVAPMPDDYAIALPTEYGPASEAEVLTWPVLTCPTCSRQHAHPPAVTATYWPTCFQCWEASILRAQEEDGT